MLRTKGTPLAVSAPRIARAVGIACVLVAKTASADVAVEWQGVAAATVGATTNVANTPESDDPQWDGYASITPGIQFQFETPRTRQSLSYVLDYRLYFVHTEASALSNGLGYAFSADVSPSTVLSLGLGASETQASTFNLVGAAGTTPALTTPNDAYLITGYANQALTSEVGPGTNFAEGLSFTINDNIPIAADGSVASTSPSLTYLGSATLSLHHELYRDTLGGSFGSDIAAFPETGTDTTTSPAHTDVSHRAAFDWRHQYSESWSHALEVGALAAYQTKTPVPVVQPAGSASLEYTTERGSAALGYAHAIQPNLILRQLTLADTITLRGGLPLGKSNFDLSGATAFLSSRSLTNEKLSPVTYNFNADVALGWTKDPLPFRLELRYQFSEQFGLGSDSDDIPEIRRQNLQFTFTAYFPHAPETGAVPRLVPLPAPTSNPSELGRQAPTRGQVEDGDRQDAKDRKEKGGSDKGEGGDKGGATP